MRSSMGKRESRQPCRTGMELARGIEPPTCGLQKPTESTLPDRESIDKIGETVDGSGK